MERQPRVVRVLVLGLPAIVAAPGKVVNRVLDPRRGKLEAVLRNREINRQTLEEYVDGDWPKVVSPKNCRNLRRAA